MPSTTVTPPLPAPSSGSLARLIESALRTLAFELIRYGDFPANYAAIDRIERRFRRVGFADRFIAKARDDQAAFRARAARLAWAQDNAWHTMPNPHHDLSHAHS